MREGDRSGAPHPKTSTDLVPLDGPGCDGPGCDGTGQFLAASGTDTDDIIETHVVVCGRRAEQVVVTSDARRPWRGSR